MFGSGFGGGCCPVPCGGNFAIVLVLFILLVIVVGACCFN